MTGLDGEPDFSGETIEAFHTLCAEYPDWDVQAGSENGWPSYRGHRRGVSRSGVVAGSVVELRTVLAERTRAALAEEWPAWRVYRLETGWYARRPVAVWVGREQLESGMAYMLRGRTAVELGELLAWQAKLGSPVCR